MNSISIILPTFNGAKFLENQLNSLLAQNYKNYSITILIYDDKSNDSTLEILQSYQCHYPNKITLLPTLEKQLGVNAAFEYLLTQTKSEFIFFCDQDDFWFSHKIHTYMDFYFKMNHVGPILLYSDPILWDGTIIIHQSMMKHHGFYPIGVNTKVNRNPLFFQNTITGHTIMINAAFKNKLLPFPKNLPMYDWYMAQMAYYDTALYFMSTQTSYYRQHLQNVVGGHRTNLLIKFYQYFKNRKKLSQKYKNCLSMLESINQTSASIALKEQVLTLLNQVKKGGFSTLIYFIKNKLMPFGLFQTIGLGLLLLFKKTKQEI